MQRKAETRTEQMRLDKWLWCARFFKTRKLAADAIKSGRVREGGQRIKVSRSIRPGDSISIRKGPYAWTVTIEALAGNRVSAGEAVRLYTEQPDSISAREATALKLKSDLARTPRPHGRPDKRERRELIRFTRRRG